MLLLATSFALFGVREAALVPAHAALLVAVCLTLFALARPFVGRGAALWGTAAVLCTPLFLRSATTFYPEVLEA
ncbi:MAG TPA: hypothetical protein VF771_01125, partial [Longimicrobiaceae bacterium]